MPRSIDGVVRPGAAPYGRPAPLLKHRLGLQPARTRRGAQADRTGPSVEGLPRRKTFQAPPQKRRRRWWRALIFPAAVLLSLSANFLVQSEPLGAAAIVVYGIVAWVKRLPSRYSFVMALLSLATAIVLLLVRQDVDLAGNFSTYTFLLLVVGIISAVRESKSYPKRKNSKIPNLRRKLRLW